MYMLNESINVYKSLDLKSVWCTVFMFYLTNYSFYYRAWPKPLNDLNTVSV